MLCWSLNVAGKSVAASVETSVRSIHTMFYCGAVGQFPFEQVYGDASARSRC
jgi:hypothetical protein